MTEPSDEAREAVRAEVGKIMAEPRWGRDKALEARVDELYKTLGSGQVVITDGLVVGPAEPQPDETPEDAEHRERNEVILAPLREEWGAEFDARDLFGAHEWSHPPAEVFADIGSRIRMNYGPKGETAALRFLAELAKIKRGG